MSDTTELLSDASGAEPASGDTPTRAPAKPRARRSGTGLSAKVLPELQKMAAELGISGTGRMRKSQLIAAIQEKQGGGSGDGATPAAAAAETPALVSTEAAPAAERPTRTRRERSRVKTADDPAPQPAPAPAADPVVVAPEPVAAAPAEPVVEQQQEAGQGDLRAER
ncbi:Rho termination factor N-terminal domain-containing protein, partial [Nonomuraea antimicrobica]|uniref:Rho termination factor N-terminal domain-containing protein n=1 Tax=Nonomuraea antimicrobica TaxID=561173 RepID=UPI0031E7B248